MSVESIEISGKVKQVITNTVTLKRTSSGMTLTIESPEIHAWLKERCTLGAVRAIQGWPREGQVLMPSFDLGLPRCLKDYGSTDIFADDAGRIINLAVLRHEKAAEGPVSVTFPGVYSFEEAQTVLQKAQDTLANIYKDHMREYKGTSTIKIVR